MNHRNSIRMDRMVLAGWRVALLLVVCLLLAGALIAASGAGRAQGAPVLPDAPQPVMYLPNDICASPHLDVATPLIDLGSGEYIRMDGTPTGATGGLYPGGVNVRPPAHEAAGVAIAEQILPLDANGNPDPANGKIVMISIGMSNTGVEFRDFLRRAEVDPEVNPQIKFINGAQPGQTAEYWADPNAPTWVTLDNLLAQAGLTPAQVEVAWIKQTLIGMEPPAFPLEVERLQGYLGDIARNLLINYPNIKIAYFSSRTRSYAYWIGQDPEPSAYESGFAVKWLVEQQINGDPSLNYDPANGDVVAPWISWGSYVWIDGENPRSDGRVWLQEDMIPDCTHPSTLGSTKVGDMLFEFFKFDSTTVGWFLSGQPPAPTATPSPTTEPPPTSTTEPPPTFTVEPPPTATDEPVPSATPLPSPTGTRKPLEEMPPHVTAPVVTWTPPLQYSLQDLPPGAQVVFLPLARHDSGQIEQFVPGGAVRTDALPVVGLWVSAFLVIGLVWGWLKRHKNHLNPAQR